ncbi:hypothetical protein BN2127_JRS10_00388 [Bacillus subtilis]|nr:hypothetical protein BN2127_JRS10_00388 [Bacillus subtilis]
MAVRVVQSVSPYSSCQVEDKNCLNFQLTHEIDDQVLIFAWTYRGASLYVEDFTKYSVNGMVHLFIKKTTSKGVSYFSVKGSEPVPYLNGTAHVIRGAKPINLSKAQSTLSNSFSFSNNHQNIILSFVGALDGKIVHNASIPSPYIREAGGQILKPWRCSVVSYSQIASSFISTSPAANFDLWDPQGVAQLPIESEDNPNLFLVQDGDIIKTYQNGNWQTI